MRKLYIVAVCALVLLAARPAAAEFISFGWAPAGGYGVTFSVGESYCPDPYLADPYAVAVPAPVYVPVPVVVYPPPPPPVVVYSPPVIYRSVIVHRPVVERRVIVRQVVREPVVVERRVVVKEPVVIHKRHPDRFGGHGFGFPPGLRKIHQRD
ncbi:MAG: hypothetical protein L0214_06790 [candidate division NC10 bacterium]|nr:hypothetical protein [candidate division NC10 bacterium]